MIWIGLLVGWGVLRAVIFRRDVVRQGKPYARRRLLGSTVIMLVLYGAVLTMLLQMENRFIYYPETDRQYWQPPPSLQFKDVQLRSPAGDGIHAWWCPQEGATYTILFSHGNAGNLSGHAWIIPALREKFRANVLIYDYPGYGKSTGTSGEGACYDAGAIAYEWLTKTQQVAPGQIILMGQSLGAAIACELAGRHPHKALVLLSPFTSVGDMAQQLFPIFPAKWFMVHRYDNLSKVKKYEQPLLIGHATNDTVIPFSHGQRLYDACPSPAKRFHEIKQGDHNDLDAAYFEAVGAFLKDLK
jgi:pimeloyl-ACP methyl ester carboxylesterase